MGWASFGLAGSQAKLILNVPSAGEKGHAVLLGLLLKFKMTINNLVKTKYRLILDHLNTFVRKTMFKVHISLNTVILIIINDCSNNIPP